MSSSPIILLENAGKAYLLYDRPQDRLKQMIFGGRKSYSREVWALHPTNLQINSGETWAIIGRNGSGKSTMLQMICGNLAPSTGRITVRGKVAALLELGAGFNPEFTGRENIYVNGALAGYEKSEVDARLEDILSFADIGDFIEQPVKTYSSGMYLRLAFSCAINVDPTILVVDEALAVGDARFQLKCFRRLEELKSKGTTLLFVSHATDLVKSLCDSAIVLDNGHTRFVGNAKEATTRYLEILFPEKYKPNQSVSADDQEDLLTEANEAETNAHHQQDKSKVYSIDDNDKTTAPRKGYQLIIDPNASLDNNFGVGGASINKILLLGASPPNMIIGGEELVILGAFSWQTNSIKTLIEEEGYESNITMGVSLSDAKGTYLFGCNGFDRQLNINPLSQEAAQFRFTFRLPYLLSETYFLTAAVALGNQKHHIQLKWYDCFLELKCETTSRPVHGLLAIDYELEAK
jgi:lipopolysaccharide transport system ATP-binding protein